MNLRRAVEISEKCRGSAFLKFMAAARTLEEQRAVCEWAGVIKKGDETEFRYALSVLRAMQDR